MSVDYGSEPGTRKPTAGPRRAKTTRAEYKDLFNAPGCVCLSSSYIDQNCLYHGENGIFKNTKAGH